MDSARHQDRFTYPCGFEGHADLTESETFRRRHEADVQRPMARNLTKEVDAAPLLRGTRGREPIDEDSLVDLVQLQLRNQFIDKLTGAGPLSGPTKLRSPFDPTVERGFNHEYTGCYTTTQTLDPRYLQT